MFAMESVNIRILDVRITHLAVALEVRGNQLFDAFATLSRSLFARGITCTPHY